MTDRRLAERACDWLALAATPAFSTMALITASQGAAHHAAPLDGMTLMYLLMSAFHAAPWVRLVGQRLAA